MATRWVVLAAAALAAASASCSDGTSPAAGNGGNHAPVIRELTAAPNPFHGAQLESAQLACIATDADGDSLPHSWLCRAGGFSYATSTTAEASWAHGVTGDYGVRVTDSDGKDVKPDSLIVTVL